MSSSRHHWGFGARALARAREPVRERTSGRLFEHTRDSGVETISEVLGSSHGGIGMIAGLASTSRVDSHLESLSSEGCAVRLPIPLLCSHAKDANGRIVSNDMGETMIGRIVYFEKRPTEVRIRAVVDSTRAGRAAWQMIVQGELKCLSVGILRSSIKLRGVVDGVKYIDEWCLQEVSICRRGANPDCYFEVY